MRALGYKSVSTVAIHIDGLISRGYVRKRDNSARSLEVVTTHLDDAPIRKAPTATQEKWMINAIRERFDSLEQHHDEAVLNELYVLIGALKILGLEDAHVAMRARLGTALKKTH
jgi:hypothetical protein